MKKTFLSIFGPAFVLLAVSCKELPFEPRILSYDGNRVDRSFAFTGTALSEEGAGTWNVTVDKKKISGEAVDYTVSFTMKEGEMPSGGAAVQFDFDDWDTENYVFAPCHIYGGNRFRILKIENPTYRDGDISVLAETSAYAREHSLGWNAWYNWPTVHVASGETVTVTLPFSK